MVAVACVYSGDVIVVLTHEQSRFIERRNWVVVAFGIMWLIIKPAAPSVFEEIEGGLFAAAAVETTKKVIIAALDDAIFSVKQ